MRLHYPILSAAFLAVLVPLARTDEKPSLADGNYVLSTVSAIGDSPVCLLKVETKGGKTAISVVATPSKSIEASVTEVNDSDGLSFGLKRIQTVKDRAGKERKLTGEGTFVASGGADRAIIPGSFGSELRPLRAKLTPTRSDKLTAGTVRGPAAGEMTKALQLNNQPLILRSKAAREKDETKKKELRAESVAAREKAEALLPGIYRDVVAQHAETDAALDAAFALIRSAGTYKVDADEAARLSALIQKHARPYGERFARPTAITLAETLVRQDGLAKVALEPIAPIAKGLTEKDSLQFRFDTLSTFKAALEGAGKSGEVRTVSARLAKLDVALDKEYLATVPPFKPAPFPGRNDTSADRTVVMELFTGAQCGPCIAADVAFDALLKSYKPSDLVLLQYHMHIPGPDALTNADTEGRWEYYTEAFPYDPEAGTGVGGTPSTLFNGLPFEHYDSDRTHRGGGPMSNAEPKFDQYRRIIDPLLEKSTRIKLSGAATRKGDEISVDATVTGVVSTDDVYLRIALVEETVKYVGSNRIRFHHNVVRAMLGGAEGLALKEADREQGSYRQTVKVDLSKLRSELIKYLDDYAANERPFRDDVRPLDLKNLKAVAFLQNDKTREILQAVQIELKDNGTGRE